jgi:Ala-tRNA(Pro) deacylase
MNKKTEILEFLTNHQFTFELVEHPALFTCDDLNKYGLTIAGTGTKNLFLSDGKEVLLVSVPEEKRVDIRGLEKLLGTKKLSFAKPELLLECLQVTPGAVTLLGVMFDQEKKVRIILDQAFKAAEFLQAHPCDNTATVVIARTELERFFKLLEREFEYLDVPSK